MRFFVAHKDGRIISSECVDCAGTLCPRRYIHANLRHEVEVRTVMQMAWSGMWYPRAPRTDAERQAELEHSIENISLVKRSYHAVPSPLQSRGVFD